MSACGSAAGGASGASAAASGPASAPEGRKLLRLEIRNAETPIERKPDWIKTKARMGPEYQALQTPREERGPAHGVPGGGLPQHLRMLGGP